MTIRVLLFAEAKLRIGAESLAIAVPFGSTVEDLRRAIAARYPALESLLTRSAFAINQRFAQDADELSEHDEVAWIPPVSGG